MVQRVFYNPTTFLGSPATSTSKIRAGAPNDAALLQVVVVQGGHHTGAGRGPTWDQWVDDLQGKIKKPETIAFPMKNGIFLWFFPLNQSIEWSSSMEFGWLIGKSTKKTWNISENPGNLFDGGKHLWKHMNVNMNGIWRVHLLRWNHCYSKNWKKRGNGCE